MQRSQATFCFLPLFLGVALTGLVSSCAPVVTKHRMGISHETIPCPDSGSTTCLLVKVDSATTWSPWPMSKEIQGFEYASGFSYDLVVEEVQQRNKKTPPWWRVAEVMSREEYVHNDPRINNTNWLLTEYGEGSNAQSIPEGMRVTLNFSDLGSISGKAPCNRYFAECGFPDENRISVSNPGSTRMACPEPEGVMQLETEYLRLLSEVDVYKHENGILTLTTESGSVLVYQQIFE